MIYPHTVTIEQKVSVPDGYGGYTVTWNALKTYDCEVVPVGGREYYVAQQMTNPITLNVNGDYDDEIKSAYEKDPDLRVNFNDEPYNIEGIIPTLPDINGDYEQMSLNCSTWGS